jgi:hypothetical protein
MTVNLREVHARCYGSVKLYGYKVVESESLLNTKEAATFLRVRDASIRRWSE